MKRVAKLFNSLVDRFVKRNPALPEQVVRASVAGGPVGVIGILIIVYMRGWDFVKVELAASNSIYLIVGYFTVAAPFAFFIVVAAARARKMGYRRVRRMPGSTLQRILQFLLPKRAYERVFLQTLADFQTEYLEALHARRRGLALWRWIQLWLTVSVTLVFWIWATLAKRFIDLWKAI